MEMAMNKPSNGNSQKITPLFISANKSKILLKKTFQRIIQIELILNNWKWNEFKENLPKIQNEIFEEEKLNKKLLVYYV